MSDLEKDETVQKPIWPAWETNRPVCSALRRVEWCIQWADFGLSQTRLLKVLDKLAKLVVLIAIFAFIRAKTTEVWNAKSVAEAKKREDMRKNIGILLPSSDVPTITRQWAFVSLNNYLTSSYRPTGSSANLNEDERFKYDAHTLQFRGLDLSQLDLTNAKLDKRFFKNTNLQSANLNGANLSGATLVEAQLEDADLTAADLTNADLTEATLSGTDRANGSGFKVLAAKLDSKTKLKGAHLSKTTLRQVVFDSVDLTGADLHGAKLAGMPKPKSGTYPGFDPASFQNADLTGANLEGIDFNGVNLTGATLTDADIVGADLTGAIGLTHKQFDGAKSDQTTKPPAQFKL